ncbi:MAG: bile acid:sodium symporter family protein [Halioglobus sp.]|nr:bile acid:sodium symporter family protein [Halioglobus sp.]
MAIEIIQLAIPFAMFTLMFAMGLSLTTADFKRVLLFPKATVIGLLIQLILLPCIGFALAYIFALSPLIAVGLVLAAACPGGTMSNVVVHMGKGDTALSITLTATASTATLFTIPLWANAALKYFSGEAASIEMPVLQTAADLSVFTVLPVILGMLARAYNPRLARHESVISKLSVLLMCIIFIVAALADDGDTIDKAGAVVIPSIILVLTAALLGVLIPYLANSPLQDCATVGVELCLKNIMLALFIATHSLQAIEAAYASAVMMIIMVPVAIGVMLFYHLAQRLETRSQNTPA